MLELGKIIIAICLNISLIRTLTVGNGIAPFRPPWRFADFTAGEELHLALKYFIRFLKIYNHYILFYKFVNSFVKFVEHGGLKPLLYARGNEYGCAKGFAKFEL